MIIVKLTGALGNQMFQYATGRRLAWKHNTELKLDISGFKQQTSDTPRSYSLDLLNTIREYPKRRDLKITRHHNGSFIERVVRSRFPHLLPKRKNYFFEENSQQFYPEVLRLPDTVYLEGFWQYVDYFRDIEPQLREEFTFVRPPKGINRKLLDQMKREEAIAIHVRRTDYITNPNYRKYYYACTQEYYRKAINYLKERVNAPVFYVFSDDIKWAKKHIKTGFKTHFISHNNGKHDEEDLRLMSGCQHNIIANSSFSWWAAWLNPNPDKIVIYPKKWFRNRKAQMNGRFPREWKRM